MNVATKTEIQPDSPVPDCQDDVWIPSSCSMCLSACSTLVHRVNGVIVKIEGNPDSAVGKGRLCAKGVSAIMTHYDPNRLRVPLRRTNPKKGIGVDPGWREISWDEAVDEIAGHLKRIRAEDPRKLFVQRTTTTPGARLGPLAIAASVGTPNFGAGGGSLHCGDGFHMVCGIMHASWTVHPDFQYCNYILSFGTNLGFSGGTVSNSATRQAADGRDRGMRVVVVDPLANTAAAKADEWVPIRVGTDIALALAMANIIVNDLRMIDAPYLKAKTNGPYLIGPDRKYVRDPATNQALVWDEASGSARPYTEARSEHMAIEGTFEAHGIRCHPAFELMKQHLRKFTPEWGEKISTVPAAHIRRLATEFATQARIGSTIVIDGVTLPYRPVAAVGFRGVQGHKNSTHIYLAIDLLNHLVGAADVVGGPLGLNSACDGHPVTEKPRYIPKPSVDGLMECGDWVAWLPPYPMKDPREPQFMGLQDLFTLGGVAPFTNSSDQEQLWSTLGLPYRPEMMINHGANVVMSLGNKDTVAETLAKYKFIVSFELFMTETAEFSDIVLPDCDNLQSYDSRSNYPFINGIPGGMGEWCWPMRHPVVEPQGSQRRVVDVCSELARRAGFLAEYNAAVNAILKLEGPYRLEPDRAYTHEEISDADLKSKFGEQHDLAWFKKNGLIKWPKKPHEVYWRPFVDVRVPIYWEFMTGLGEKIAAIAGPKGFHVPLEYYQPLPDWLPCPSHQCEAPGFDLFAFYWKHSAHTHGYTIENPWLDEAAKLDPIIYKVAINTETGRRKGLQNESVVEIATQKGRRITGRVRLIEGIHPEAIGIGLTGGHWAKGMPVAEGKGVLFNDLLELDWEHTDPVSLNMDLCAKVRIAAVEDAS